ncbi:hypothetical protein CAEBREN_07374 [Caenorhabditis brenneri]|uniref:RING-type domain-containing protein n=1 Tax=Caenorhabditis brenneri TaxID=135651 RepID=G0NX01_CAEBE|nr:hypothetical protein CAEBREN_07374 [Caenorhabditis brenneri]
MKDQAKKLRAAKERFDFKKGFSVLYSGSSENARKIKTREVEALNKKVDEQDDVIVPALNKKEKKNDQPFEWLCCEKCSEPFSNTETDRIPKVLDGCDHTICLGCIMDLKRPHIVICPICKKMTRFKENLSNSGMKTNFTVFEISRRQTL